MESRIKYQGLGHFLAKDLVAGEHTGHIGHMVQRSQRRQRSQLLHQLIVDQHGLAEQHTALHHAVTDGGDLVQALDHTSFRIQQGIFHLFERLGMVLHGIGVGKRAAIGRFMGEFTLCQANAFAIALGQCGFAFHINKLILQRGTTCVDN